MSESRLSEKAKENLRRKRNTREKGNRLIKMRPNEKGVLGFNPEQIDLVETKVWNLDTGKWQIRLVNLESISKEERDLK